jgi:UDP-galactopyranose mutase
MAKPVAIVGAGLSGAVLARELAEGADMRVVVIERQPHVGGHCHTERDGATGVLLHRYGAHVFHTSRKETWDYVSRFDQMRALDVRVKAVTRKGVFSLPVNLLTLNQYFGRVMAPAEARALLDTLGDKSIENPRSFEEYALSELGRELYENFFRGYTQKQWGVDPKFLPASVLKRLPIRFSYDDRYLSDAYQGVPESGYTELIVRMLDHDSITVRTNELYDPAAQRPSPEFSHVFYSGPLDAFFAHCLGRLGYRSLRFERLDGSGDLQGGPLLTYTDEAVPYTRSLEHKHLAPWEERRDSVVYFEYSHATEAADTPFYPLRLVGDQNLLASYVELAEQEHAVTFFGRLGTYRYLDMNIVIEEARELAATFIDHRASGRQPPAFSRRPL